ncbi:MAG: FAD/NAD(P)-binding protein [Pseudomonadota bacterium]
MYHPSYRTARLADIRQETADTSSYTFVPDDGEALHFCPGQFNMLGLPGVGEAAISCSSLPDGNAREFTHTIRRVGNVTRLIAGLERGGNIMFRGPLGRGWPIQGVAGKDVLLIAGGIGLAPVTSLLHYCLEHRVQIGKLVFVYGAKTPRDMIFHDELRAWQESDSLETIYCVDEFADSDLNLRAGLVTQHMEGLSLNPSNSIAFTCGPEIMMRFAARQLVREGFREESIYVSLERNMRCGTAHCGHCQIGAKFVCQDGPVFSYPDIARFSDTLL